MVLILTALVLFLVSENGLLAQQDAQTPKVGSHIGLNMTGDLAKEFARRTGGLPGNNVPKGLQISTIATVEQQLSDGRLRIGHTSPVNVDGKTVRLVTFTGTIDPTAIKTRVIPKGTTVAANPGGKSVPSSEETKQLELTLTDLKGVKLRIWTLAEEIGE